LTHAACLSISDKIFFIIDGCAGSSLVEFLLDRKLIRDLVSEFFIIFIIEAKLMLKNLLLFFIIINTSYSFI